MTSTDATAPAPTSSERRVPAFLGLVAPPLGAVLVALALGALLVLLANGNPVSALGALIDGAFGNPLAIGEVLAQATPLLIIGLGLSLAFRAGVWNIGAEGQLFMGALLGGALAVLLPASLGGLLLIVLALLGGVVGGAVWGIIVGVLRARWKVNEVITSLLLNYVAILTFSYMIRRPLGDPHATSGLSGKKIVPEAALPMIGSLGVSIGIIIAAVLVPIVWYAMARTPFGFRGRMLGLGREAAEVAGVRGGAMVIKLMAISGALAGLAGVIQVIGVSGRLDPGISSGIGYTAIVVALIGRCHAVGVVLSALLIATLQAGGQAMSVTENLPYSIVLAIEGLFVIFLLIADRFARRG